MCLFLSFSPLPLLLLCRLLRLNIYSVFYYRPGLSKRRRDKRFILIPDKCQMHTSTCCFSFSFFFFFFFFSLDRCSSESLIQSNQCGRSRRVQLFPMHKSVSSCQVETAENIPFKLENWSSIIFSFRNLIHKIIIFFSLSWISFLENDPQCFDSAVNQFEIIARYRRI